MLVLALDTSTPLITVTLAAVDPGPLVTPLAHAELDNAFAHAEQLMPLTRQALSEAGRALSDVTAVVVGVGPGPFTGLRVGIATAAALGDGLGIAVYPVPSHLGFALASRTARPSQHSDQASVADEMQTPGEESVANGSRRNACLLVVTDARRKEVFVTGFDGDVPVLGPLAVSPSALTDLLADNDFRPQFLVGPGTDLLEDVGSVPVASLDSDLGLGLVRAAAQDILDGVPPGPLTPLYLRRPDAVEPSKTRKSVLGR